MDCIWSQWSEFGDCSQTCGHGVKSRSRYIVSTEQIGGRACGDQVSISPTIYEHLFHTKVKQGAFLYRYPSLVAVDTFRHFGPRILNSQIKRPFLTGKLSFFPFLSMWMFEFADKKSANNLQFRFEHFLRKEIGRKVVCKMLVKLTKDIVNAILLHDLWWVHPLKALVKLHYL